MNQKACKKGFLSFNSLAVYVQLSLVHFNKQGLICGFNFIRIQQAFKVIYLLSCYFFMSIAAKAQSCPPNIDFESGTLDGWKCYTGNVADQGGINVFSLTESLVPIPGRHSVIAAANAYADPYGGFSTVSPNGSDYCIKLGNNTGGGEGEAVSYEFTIPANRNTYSLLYYYAVVFQGPNHQEQQQPRMEIEILNVSTNTRIDCASFSFIPFGSALPGFFESNVQDNNTPTWCKDWTPVTINLDGNAGKTIRLTFRTGDCTFRRHFGYAYIDVASDCSGEFTGASYCPLDKEVTVSAPFGFQSYTWFNSDMTQKLGTGQTITLSPLPAPGTVLNVQLVPFDGYGCPQTLTAKLQDNLQVDADAGKDALSCNLAPVRIGNVARTGLSYSWTPATGLSNANAANPLANPLVSTDYILTIQSPGGGCVDKDTVKVIASNLGSSMQLIGKPQYCIGSGDSSVLEVGVAQTIRWYKDGQEITGEKNNRFRVKETGKYIAFLQDEYGCTATTPEQPINISTVPDASFSIADTSQCLIGNRFVFTNSSTNLVGAMHYFWDFGGAGTTTQQDAVYNFTNAGQYPVKLVVKSNDVCADSITALVTVYPNPVPVFDAPATCIGFSFVPANLTDDNIGSPIKYVWKYGNDIVSEQRQPPARIFATPGNYNLTLSVSSEQCPSPVQVLTKTLIVESPLTPKRYTAAFALRSIPLNIEARNIGVTALWQPARQLNDPQSYKPVFKGTLAQDYTITLTTKGGCVTVDSLLVQIVEKADIAVPNAFTPNGDGLNDYLRPIPLGVAEIRYFRIYNRWGEVLFESRNSKPGWDGTFKGIQQPAQNLAWMVEGVGMDGSVITKKGTSILIR